MAPARDSQEYGLTATDRVHEIAKKFGEVNAERANDLLSSLQNPTDQLLGAVLFLARPGRIEDLIDLIALANDNPTRLLNAATTADERRPW